MKKIIIEPTTVIFCDTYGKALELSQMSSLPREFVIETWNVYDRNTCYQYMGSDNWKFGKVQNYLDFGIHVVAFEDLVEQCDTVVEKTHICCELMSGEVLDFNEMCNEIDAEAGNTVIRFMAVNAETNKGINLAVIPVANIKKIDYMHTREHIIDILGEEEIKSGKEIGN